MTQIFRARPSFFRVRPIFVAHPPIPS